MHKTNAYTLILREQEVVPGAQFVLYPLEIEELGVPLQNARGVLLLDNSIPKGESTWWAQRSVSNTRIRSISESKAVFLFYGETARAFVFWQNSAFGVTSNESLRPTFDVKKAKEARAIRVRYLLQTLRRIADDPKPDKVLRFVRRSLYRLAIDYPRCSPGLRYAVSQFFETEGGKLAHQAGYSDNDWWIFETSKK